MNLQFLHHPSATHVRHQFARAASLWLGIYALLGSLTAGLTGFNPNLWWVDLRYLPRELEIVLTSTFAVGLLAYSLSPGAWMRIKKPSVIVLGLFVLFTLRDAIVFWSLIAQGRITTVVVLPFSFFVNLLLWLILVAMLHDAPPRSLRLGIVWPGATAMFLGTTFPLLQVFCLGKTDYERHADTAVVFGARVYGDGQMSMALRDRVQRACELYRDGRVSMLIMSGGPGDGAVHETEAMRAFALRSGVPAEAIWMDRNGLDTLATTQNSLKLIRQNRGFGRLIAVSEFYHLPRIKFTYQALGQEVLTVPARPSHPARNLAARSMLREVPAFWFYFARSVGNAITG
jgi:uncharacterized SAM-binding protein YcdF (DUF218 family)